MTSYHRGKQQKKENLCICCDRSRNIFTYEGMHGETVRDPNARNLIKAIEPFRKKAGAITLAEIEKIEREGTLGNG